MHRGQQNVDVTQLVIIALGLLLAIYGTWVLAGHYIVNTAISIASILINSSNYIYENLPNYSWIDTIFYFFVDEMFIKEKASVLSQIQAYSSNKPTLADAKNVFYVIGYFLKMPIILLATWGSVLCYRYSRPSQLKRSFNIFSLAQYSQKYFPQIRPAFINNLLDKGHDDGSYRQEVSPIRLAILNNAVTYTGENGISYKVAFGKKLMMNDTKKLMTIIDSYNEDEGLPILHGRIKINIKKIREIFKYQIIKHGEWKEPNNLSPQLKALYAIFLLFIEGGSDNKERAFEMLDKFSSTYKSTRSLAKNFMFDDSGVDDVISELGTQVAVKKIQEKHTYTITVLMAMYHRATHRKSKLPPSRFLWLKEADRGAWYALHQNLSPGAWSEGAGPRGIFLTEIKLNKMAQYPFTDNAIKGYLAYINNEGWLIEQPKNISEVAA